MLFRVYSRYVPNLTRLDGSAMERLLASQMSQGPLIAQVSPDSAVTIYVPAQDMANASAVKPAGVQKTMKRAPAPSSVSQTGLVKKAAGSSGKPSRADDGSKPSEFTPMTWADMANSWASNGARAP